MYSRPTQQSRAWLLLGSRSAVAGALLLLAACQWGIRPSKFQPALGPTGAQIAVRVKGEATDRRGELFASDSSGIVLQSTKLVHVSWNRIAALDVDQLGADYDVAPSESPRPDKRARLALISRFPQGLQGDLLARVLAALNQPSLEEIR